MGVLLQIPYTNIKLIFGDGRQLNNTLRLQELIEYTAVMRIGALSCQTAMTREIETIQGPSVQLMLYPS